MPDLFSLTEQYRNQLMNREDSARLAMLKDYRGVWGGLDQKIETAARRIEFTETEKTDLAEAFKDEITGKDEIAGAGAGGSSGPAELSADKLGRFTDLLLKKNSWQELERDLDGQFRSVADNAAQVTEQHRRALGQTAVDHAVKLMLAQLGKERVAGMSKEALEALNKKAKTDVEEMWQRQRDNLSEIFRAKAAEISQRAREALRQETLHGLLVNANARQILGRVKQAIDDREANPEKDPTLVRALRAEYRIATQNSYRESLRFTFAESGRVSQWRWTSARTAKTCAVCWAMDGKVFPVDTPLRSHPHCRCVPVPVVEDEQGNLLRRAEREGGETGDVAFADMPAAQQKAILGARAFDAYERGEFDLSDLVGVQFNTRFGVALYRQSVDDAREKARKSFLLPIQNEIKAGLTEEAARNRIDPANFVAANITPFGTGATRDTQIMPRQGADTGSDTSLTGLTGLGGFGGGSGGFGARLSNSPNGGQSLVSGGGGKTLTFYTKLEEIDKTQAAEAIIMQGRRAVGDWLKFVNLVNKFYRRSFSTIEQIIAFMASQLRIPDNKKTHTASKTPDGKLYFQVDFGSAREGDFWYTMTIDGIKEKKKQEAEEVGEKPEEFIGSNPYFEPDEMLDQKTEEGAENLPENKRTEGIYLAFPDDGSEITMRRLLRALIFTKWTQGDLFFDALDRIVDEAIRQRLTLVAPEKMSVLVTGKTRLVKVHVAPNWLAAVYRLYVKEKERQVEAEEIWRQITENNELARIARGLAKGAWKVPVGIYEIVTDIPGTAEAVWTMITDPVGTYEALKKALGDKWEAYQKASYYDKFEMVAELGGEIIAEILLTKGATKLAKTPLELARLTRRGEMILNKVDNVIEKVDDVLDTAKTLPKEVVTTVVKTTTEVTTKVTKKVVTKTADALKALLGKLDEAMNKLPRGSDAWKAAKKYRDRLLNAIREGKTTIRDIFSPATQKALNAVFDQVVNPSLKTLKTVKGKTRQALDDIRRKRKLTELELKEADDLLKNAKNAGETVTSKISIPPPDMPDELIEARNLLVTEKAKKAYDKIYESVVGNNTSKANITKFRQVIDDLDDVARKLDKPNDEILDNIAALADERKRRKMKPYEYKGKDNGTVARVENSDTFGLNTNARGGLKNLDNELPRQEIYEQLKEKGLVDKNGKFKGRDSLFLTHAEAEALILEATKNGGKLPKKVTMYVDRRTCNLTCISTTDPNVGLSKLAKFYGMDELTIIDSLGNRFIVKPDMVTEVIERASKKLF